METRYLALLRGVNVGRGNRLAMADLRTLVESCGFTDVATVLASGNAVFTAARATKPVSVALRLERALADGLALSVRVTVVDAAALDAIVATAPAFVADADPSRVLVAFPRTPAALALLRPLTKRDWAPAALVVGKAAAWLWCPNGVLADALFKAVTGATGDELTTRNWGTVLKLRAALTRGR